MENEFIDHSGKRSQICPKIAPHMIWKAADADVEFRAFHVPANECIEKIDTEHASVPILVLKSSLDIPVTP
ncbi:hypothetical protein BVRB_032400 [Beta vulgaris subsp. vulgaris]|uniref:Uncharacterized protein n=1 Tax=Beta vulgaris subsp. vulgaris TaxID=3555 RepID=A0A0J8B0C6_BETVV|nr:hypothetical protein BVRB_032400 [Beta vulgaris subsp. vulgaris]